MSNDPMDTAYKFPNINYDDPCLLQYVNPTSSSSSTSTMPTKSLLASTSMSAISDYQCTNLTLASSSNNTQSLSAVPNTFQSEEQTFVQLQHVSNHINRLDFRKNKNLHKLNKQFFYLIIITIIYIFFANK